MTGALFFLAFAVLSAILTWTAFSTGRMTLRAGRYLLRERSPRYFMILLAARGGAAVFFAVLALTFAVGWMPPKS
ncbi:MAG TPA: hypothetical protein VGI95_11650 [Caulobacteraceae bacterium]|jgi:hypothetical protein